MAHTSTTPLPSATRFITANDGTNGTELWKLDNTVPLVQDIRPGLVAHTLQFRTVGDTLYFTANDGTNGTELWKLDNTGVPLVQDKTQGLVAHTSTTTAMATRLLHCQ